jgi:hypothetical protein
MISSDLTSVMAQCSARASARPASLLQAGALPVRHLDRRRRYGSGEQHKAALIVAGVASNEAIGGSGVNSPRVFVCKGWRAFLWVENTACQF